MLNRSSTFIGLQQTDVSRFFVYIVAEGSKYSSVWGVTMTPVWMAAWIPGVKFDYLTSIAFL